MSLITRRPGLPSAILSRDCLHSARLARPNRVVNARSQLISRSFVSGRMTFAVSEVRLMCNGCQKGPIRPLRRHHSRTNQFGLGGTGEPVSARSASEASNTRSLARRRAKYAATNPLPSPVHSMPLRAPPPPMEAQISAIWLGAEASRGLKQLSKMYNSRVSRLRSL
jgi:hypothetical protein